jgi:hypothetical protein
VLNALLDLRCPDPAPELLASLGVDTLAARERFDELDQNARPGLSLAAWAATSPMTAVR